MDKRCKGAANGRYVEDCSDELLSVEFANYWSSKWPNQTTDVNRLEMSAHYVGCRDAFFAGAMASKKAVTHD